jgi:hypothetical protein
MRRGSHRPGGAALSVGASFLIPSLIDKVQHAALAREVRANLVYRCQFTQVGAAKVPDATTLGKFGVTLGPKSSDWPCGRNWLRPTRPQAR